MRIVLSFFPAVMMPRWRAGWRLSRLAMGAWTFTYLEAGVHQARLKCLIGIARFTLFGGLAFTDAAIAGIGRLFATIKRV
jgi:hypothetical protein